MNNTNIPAELTHRELMNMGYCLTSSHKHGMAVCYAREDAHAPVAGMSHPAYWRPLGTTVDRWIRDDAAVHAVLRATNASHKAADRHGLGGRR